MSAGPWTSRRTLVAGAVAATVCAAVGVWIVAGMLHGRDDTEQIRRAIVRDAGYTRDQWQVLESKLGWLDRAPYMFANLTDYLFMGDVREAPTFWPVDFERSADAGPTAMVGAFSRGEFASVVQPGDITSFYCRLVDGNSAWGTLTYEFETLWRGRLDFKAERRGGSWVITAFGLPGARRELRLMDNGLWMACPLERRGALLNRIIVQVDAYGVVSMMGRAHDPASLREVLAERARHSPKDARGLPELQIHITADPFTHFGHVHAVIVMCRDLGIRRMRWSLHGDDLDLLLRGAEPPHDASVVHRGVRTIRIAWDKSPVRAFVTEGESALVSVGPGVAIDDPDEHPRRPLGPSAQERGPREASVEVGADVPFQWLFNKVEACRESGVERFDFRIAR